MTHKIGTSTRKVRWHVAISSVAHSVLLRTRHIEAVERLYLRLRQVEAEQIEVLCREILCPQPHTRR
jgi:hypothetical protein